MEHAHLFQLIRSLTWREIAMRYSGTVLGIFWAFFAPLLLLGVYSIIFGGVFKARWPGLEGGISADFALVLFVGLIVFTFFSECINRAPTLILSQPNYVKKVVFPLGALPVVAVLSAFFHVLISVVAWAVIYTFLVGPPPITIVSVPLVLLPLLIGTLGLVFFVSSIGVYLRDMSQLMLIVSQSLLFLSPVFYSVEQVPGIMQTVLAWNPLSYIMEQSREAMMFAHWPDWNVVISAWLVSLVMLGLGYQWFRRAKSGFADVI